jgi:hypothetical protein
MFSIWVPALRRWELTHAVKVWKVERKDDNLLRKLFFLRPVHDKFDSVVMVQNFMYATS